MVSNSRVISDLSRHVSLNIEGEILLKLVGGRNTKGIMTCLEVISSSNL